MSYALACYALVVAGVLGYAARLERARRRLASALEAQEASNRG